MKNIALAAASLAFAVNALAQDARPMVEWVAPALPTNKPQTPEQAKSGQERGRDLPPPEILQPTLDPALPAYRPRSGITGSFKGAASDVLVVLANKLFEKFRQYQPGVTLSISPPYAGSLGAKELVKGDLDFVFVSRELKPDDITDFEKKYGYAPLSVPIHGGSYRHFGALDAVGFFVNKENPVDKLTFVFDKSEDVVRVCTRTATGQKAAWHADFAVPCGVTMTFGSDQNGLSGGSGSTPCASSPAPAIRPSRSASSNASRTVASKARCVRSAPPVMRCTDVSWLT